MNINKESHMNHTNVTRTSGEHSINVAKNKHDAATAGMLIALTPPSMAPFIRYETVQAVSKHVISI